MVITRVSRQSLPVYFAGGVVFRGGLANPLAFVHAIENSCQVSAGALECFLLWITPRFADSGLPNLAGRDEG